MKSPATKALAGLKSPVPFPKLESELAALNGWIAMSGVHAGIWKDGYRQARQRTCGPQNIWNLSFFDWAQLLVTGGAWGVGRFQPENYELRRIDPALGYKKGNIRLLRE